MADPATDPYGIAVSPARFAEQLEVLRRLYVPLGLDLVVEALAHGAPPSKGVVVTFDDGYADVLHAARPLLERWDIPATVYVVTGQPGEPTEFWWDILARVILEAESLPERLTFAIGRSRVSLRLPPGTDSNGQGPRITALRTVFDRLRRYHPLDCDATVRDMAEAVGVALAPRTDRQRLDPEEVVALDGHSLISVGAHSVSHPMLSRLDKAQCQEEIVQSKRYLERLLERPVTSFAYPYGAGTRAASLVRQAGFLSACTTENRLVARRADPFRLPRIYVGDWDGEELARRLAALH